MVRTDFYIEKEMAEILGYSMVTMKKNRCLGIKHPPYKKLGCRIVYPKTEYTKWEKGIVLETAIRR